jgi:hypothetical protein
MVPGSSYCYVLIIKKINYIKIYLIFYFSCNEEKKEGGGDPGPPDFVIISDQLFGKS